MGGGHNFEKLSVCVLGGRLSYVWGGGVGLSYVGVGWGGVVVCVHVRVGLCGGGVVVCGGWGCHMCVGEEVGLLYVSVRGGVDVCVWCCGM